MTAFLVLGVAGIVVIAAALLLGDLLHGAFEALPGGDWLSTEAAGGFLSALGFGGAIAQEAGAPSGVAVVVGILAGLAVGALAASLTRLVRGGGTDATPSTGDVVGYDAVVISAIPENGLGTVRVRLGGHTLRYSARADLPLEAGSAVHVTGVLSPTAVTVAPTWSVIPPAGD